MLLVKATFSEGAVLRFIFQTEMGVDRMRFTGPVFGGFEALQRRLSLARSYHITSILSQLALQWGQTVKIQQRGTAAIAIR